MSLQPVARGVPLLAFLLLSPGPAAAGDEGAPLTLAEAAQRALAHQPLLDAGAAAVRAARARAVADARLPDPVLMAALRDLPVNGDPAFTLGGDDFTILAAGIRQEFPRAEKRRLRGERGRVEAEASALDLAAMEREIRRDAALAWLDVYEAERAAELTGALRQQYEAERAAVAIAVRTNRASQADLLAAQVEAALVEDRLRGLERDAARARAALGRWIGADARRPVSASLGGLAEPAPLEETLRVLERHPRLGSFDQRERLAQTEVALARADYQPDWALSLDYGYRTAFPDFVGIQFEMDLPLFTAHRQDRALESRVAAAEEARAVRADLQRRLAAEAAVFDADWRAARERLARFEAQILPAAANRVEATRLAYGSGRGSFAEVLLARRALLEAQLMRLEQRVAMARAHAQLAYLAE
jgi:outer membrane protein TolC